MVFFSQTDLASYHDYIKNELYKLFLNLIAGKPTTQQSKQNCNKKPTTQICKHLCLHTYSIQCDLFLRI